jgi:hypothetical protein
MDFGLALTFQFKDPDWVKKILLASLITLIPVVGWIFVFGWSLEITRRVIHGEMADQTLPEIDFAKDLVRGLLGFLINLVYNLPALVISIPFLALFFLASAAFANGQVDYNIWLVSLICILPIVFVYNAIITMFVSAAYGNFLDQDESLTAGFQLGRVYKLVRRAPLAYFLVLVGQFLCSFIAFFGLAACIIGVVVTSAYTLTAMGHLYGQAYLEAQKKM